MRQLLPEPRDDVDLYDATRPPVHPVLRLNFVSSADGAVTDAEGRSGGLGGEGDQRLFQTLRAHADAIVVGAGTARTEGYGPHRPSPELAHRRRDDGRAASATMVLVTRTLALDLTSELFTAQDRSTVVLTCAAAPSAQRRAVEAVATVLVAGEAAVDLALGMRMLVAQVGGSLLSEGGPQLAQGLFVAEVVDELCLTVAPLLQGREGPRLTGDLAQPVDLHLAGLLAEGSELYLRYRVGRN